MSFYETKDSPLYHAMAPFFPAVYPTQEFNNNLYAAMAADLANRFAPVDVENEWLVKNAGLIVDPDRKEVTFRVVDKRVYSFALLRWS